MNQRVLPKTPLFSIPADCLPHEKIEQILLCGRVCDASQVRNCSRATTRTSGDAMLDASKEKRTNEFRDTVRERTTGY
jgi:regulatory protein YycH of two-component signal transduction system YycFG